MSKLTTLRVVLLLIFCISCSDMSAPDSSLHVIGGRPVEPGSLIERSTAALLNESYQTICTGTLASRKHVITAAHCVGHRLDKQLFISFGTDVTNPAYIFQNALEVSRITLNPEFDNEKWQTAARIRSEVQSLEELLEALENNGVEEESMTLRYRSKMRNLRDQFNSLSGDLWSGDIAVLELVEPAPENYQAPAIVNEQHRLGPKTELIAAGYGRNTPMVKGTTLVSSDNAPRSGVLIKARLMLSRIDESDKLQFLTSPEDNAAACLGDSGGPLFESIGNQDLPTGLRLVGVINLGDCKKETVAADLTKYSKFLAETLNSLTN